MELPSCYFPRRTDRTVGTALDNSALNGEEMLPESGRVTALTHSRDLAVDL